MLSCALFKLAPERSKVQKRLAMLAMSKTSSTPVNQVSRHKNLISAMQGLTNLTNVISAHCAAAGIPCPQKVNDETMKLLINVVYKQTAINPKSSSYNVVSSTFIKMNPKFN